MLRSISLALVAVSMLALGLAGEAGTSPAAATNDTVEIPIGGDVMIAVVSAHTGPDPVPDVGEGQLNATNMAIDDFGLIKGFGVVINDFDGGCNDVDGAAAATAVTSDQAHVGVIGHTCTPSMLAGLPLYEASKVVTISGSATGTELPAAGETVFNRTIVDEPDDPAGFSASVRAQPQFADWAERYNQFITTNSAGAGAEPLGAAEPPVFAEFFYDAAMLLLTRIDEVATVDNDGALLIDRNALAAAVRNTTDFRGVTCDITLDGGGTREPDLDDLIPCDPGGTKMGADVSVPLEGGLGSHGGVELTFSSVTGSGTTTLTTSAGGPPPPSGFRILGPIGGPPVYYNIETTATFSGLVMVCIEYDPTQVSPGAEGFLKLYHKKDSGQFVPITTSVDTFNNIICGVTDSLSPFAIAEPVPAGVDRIWGDVDCKDGVKTRDNQALLRNVLEQNPLSQNDPCPDIGETVSVDGVDRIWGDVDCKDGVKTRDNQALLRNVLEQNPLSQSDPCPDIGELVQVGPI